MTELSFPQPTYYEPQVGDWILLWTGKAHRVLNVKRAPGSTWLAFRCGMYIEDGKKVMGRAVFTDRRCKHCSEGAVKKWACLT